MFKMRSSVSSGRLQNTVCDIVSAMKKLDTTDDLKMIKRKCKQYRREFNVAADAVEKTLEKSQPEDSKLALAILYDIADELFKSESEIRDLWCGSDDYEEAAYQRYQDEVFEYRRRWLKTLANVWAHIYEIETENNVKAVQPGEQQQATAPAVEEDHNILMDPEHPSLKAFKFLREHSMGLSCFEKKSPAVKVGNDIYIFKRAPDSKEQPKVEKNVGTPPETPLETQLLSPPKKMELRPMVSDLETCSLPVGAQELEIVDTASLEKGIVSGFNLSAGGAHVRYLHSEFVQKMADYCKTEAGKQPYRPNVNELCLVRRSHVQCLRGVLVGTPKNGTVFQAKVRYVDYGHHETVPITALRKIPVEFVTGYPAGITQIEIKDFPKNVNSDMFIKAMKYLESFDEMSLRLPVTSCRPLKPGVHLVEAPELLKAMSQ